MCDTKRDDYLYINHKKEVRSPLSRVVLHWTMIRNNVQIYFSKNIRERGRDRDNAITPAREIVLTLARFNPIRSNQLHQSAFRLDLETESDKNLTEFIVAIFKKQSSKASVIVLEKIVQHN